MSRAWKGLLVVVALLGAMVVLLQAVSSRSGTVAAKPLTTSEVMDQWSRYAQTVLLPQEEVLVEPSNVIELMNEHSAPAFPGRPRRFVLWQDGDPIPAGLTVNPDASPLEDWNAIDAACDSTHRDLERWWRWTTEFDGPAPGSTKLPLPGLELRLESLDLFPPPPKRQTARHNTLWDQTTDFLGYRYDTQLRGDTIYVYRKGYFLPAIVKREFFPLNPDAFAARALHAGCPKTSRGEIDLRPLFGGIEFKHGTSAWFEPNRGVVEIQNDQEQLDTIDAGYFGGGCTGIAAADSQFERLQWRAWIMVWDVREKLHLP